ncbi:putative cytochrome b5 [Golovinomyces cichoracearum]|uniref:Putative cytochrome b5 n=1 Tax=Golovinomyces cichoracearum TaxID=62708 RepID=A0A420IXQ2_9PEZI|nr:putative cytochrome b5 [Golovinomyces cichoracearum]
MQTFTLAEVATHKDATSGMYLVIDHDVYDITNFVDDHPGGSKIIQRFAGKDATKQFWKYHSEDVMKKYGTKLKIGEIRDKAKL